MRMRHIVGAVFCATLTLCSLSPAGRAAELTESEFRRLHRELKPAADEAWRTIPWKITVLDAQQAAARDNKPIFIWAMDGHPLGCT